MSSAPIRAATALSDNLTSALDGEALLSEIKVRKIFTSSASTTTFLLEMNKADAVLIPVWYFA
ncbi:MAG TPA: hypothetical protein VGQ03_09505 [Nitrososphaera sp.]|jgi:hypothetical protein|nr:hypothetical protein [Nitrososphaera sp.]